MEDVNVVRGVVKPVAKLSVLQLTLALCGNGKSPAVFSVPVELARNLGIIYLALLRDAGGVERYDKLGVLMLLPLEWWQRR